ncbi:DUF4124 domain-containing protein [Aliikangiella marina]|uniref:DUF4124 domain-containing protein n=1 Tax=Aliikangiella marina TaxID=1712262 RepID=A0A545TI73_9GAMM|nr:DUF4124 domain-containing protein [Aliikangiella marina]TQV76908.1 DUF4124 domain-containing protein [Aliikangiella marina]
MFRKFLLALVLFALIVAGLQIFGGRDFGQMSLAMDKYQSGGSFGDFFADVVTIFKGDKVKESIFPHSRYREMVMYRWKDEFGEVHVSERQPNVENYEVIRLGDMDIQIQESMSEEEIKQILKKND